MRGLTKRKIQVLYEKIAILIDMQTGAVYHRASTEYNTNKKSIILSTLAAKLTRKLLNRQLLIVNNWF